MNNVLNIQWNFSVEKKKKKGKGIPGLNAICDRQAWLLFKNKNLRLMGAEAAGRTVEIKPKEQNAVASWMSLSNISRHWCSEGKEIAE